MTAASVSGAGSAAVAPGSGARQCAWTASYSQGTTSITLNTCGATPTSNGLVVGQMMILDQANDLTDNGGIFHCDTYTTSQAGGAPACTANDGSPGTNIDGRPITLAGLHYSMSQKQVVTVQSISGSGTGPYTVTFAPGVYFNNVRSGQSPGAWFPGTVKNDGLENVYLDATNIGASCGSSFDCASVALTGCYQCWVTGISSYNAQRAHVILTETMNNVVRSNYFFQSHSHSTVSYGTELEQTSADLIENNICQQVTDCQMVGNTSGSVFDYNFNVGGVYVNTNYLQATFSCHNAANDMNLWEGNNLLNTNCDDTWGSSDVDTYFRNFETGWQHQSSGPIYNTIPYVNRAWARAHNIVGNVFGQPSYHTNYESYATSTTGGTNASLEAVSIYSLGWTGVASSSAGTCNSPPGTGNAGCDSAVRPTLMRWGNWDIVNAATQWNSTEASPGAVSFVNANFSTSYFNTLAHTLPTSLFYPSTPSTIGCGTGLSFWKNPTLGTCPPFPPVGPDVTAGNLGTCSGGSYPGAQATASGQCTSGSLSGAWSSHAAAIPAQVCYLSVMNGPPDGTGAMLGFSPSSCYASDTFPIPSVPALTLRLQ